jgi:hypothetical protein
MWRLDSNVYYLNARHLPKHEYVSFETFWNCKLGIVENKGICTYMHLVFMKLDEVMWKKVRMHMFVASHELAMCTVDNNVEVQMVHKST